VSIVANPVNVEVIAELAQGFEGSPEQGWLLLRAAAAAGADAAKYQLVYADELATPDYKHYPLFRALEMPEDAWKLLTKESRSLGIELYVDVFGPRSLSVAERLGLTAIKLHPTDISNIGFLEQVGRSSVPRVILGAGGAYAGELARALDLLATKDVVVLFGFQSYPTPTDANQISRIAAFAGSEATRRGVTCGFADHASPGDPARYALAAAAVGAGARVVEKHLTLGRVMKLEDYESALNPDEFSVFCRVIRGCAAAMGAAADRDDFGMSDAEIAYRKSIRRHVVAVRDLVAGATLTPADLGLKRTSAADPLTDLEAAYGRSLAVALNANSPVTARELSR
jgi:N,N'-diacetyllegionaminate synthase